jgi:translation initiation factor 1
MAKKLNSFDGLVFSTNRNIDLQKNDDEPEDTISPEKQNLKVNIDKRNRGGKVVTLITGFVGSEESLSDLCKSLKTKCGVGGSAKDGEIIIQGELKDKVVNILKSLSYRVK